MINNVKHDPQTPIPADPDQQNEDRATWVDDALKSFADATRLNPSPEADGWETVVTDFLADLLHFCDRHNINFAAQLKNGHGLYQEEIFVETES